MYRIKRMALYAVSILGSIIGVVLILILIVCLILFVHDWDKYGIKTSLWGCDDKLYYSNGGVSDYIDYGEYYFNETSIKKFENDEKYSMVMESDIEYIRSYFSDFDDWINLTDYKDKYAFDKDTQINAGDYYYIYNRYDDSPYINYDVYYVDMDCNTVYFIHSNI